MLWNIAARKKREKEVLKSPRAFQNLKISNHSSADDAQSNAERIPNRPTRQGSCGLFYPFIGTKPTRSLTTSPPMIRPATEGTKALEPGTERRWRALALSARRADAVVLAADVVILDGSHDRLLGVDHLQVLDFALAALDAHHLGQRADRGLVDVGHLKAGRVHLVTCAHGADDGSAHLLALHHQRQLAGNGVDGIHHIVVLGKVEVDPVFPDQRSTGGWSP